jgi:hypothetical protein
MSENETVEVADQATEIQKGNLSPSDLLNYLSAPQSEEAEIVATDQPDPEAEAEEAEQPVLLQSEKQIEDESDDADETEEVEEASDEPKGVQKLVRQVGKLTARAKTAEEQVEALKAQIESIKVDKKPSGNPTVDKINTIEELQELRKQALSAKKWARKHEGEEFVQDGDQEYTGEQIRQIRDQAEEHLDELIPERLDFLQKKSGSEQQALRDFEFLKDQKSEQFKLLQNFMGDKTFKILDTLPNGLYLRALMVEGHFAQKSKKTPKKVVAKVKPKPPTDHNSDVSPPIRNAKLSDKDLKKKFLGEENISSDQLTAFFRQS